jgi:magnesium-transporting ATPase (P-type)
MQEVPADCVVLATSDEAALCHIETANLDGETNLKLKYAFDGTKTITTADQLMDFEAR